MPGKTVRSHESGDDADRDLTKDADTEGHNMMIDPSAGRVFQNQRNKDMERAAKQRQREKDARGR